jgi:hypothetical protein
MRRSLGTRLLNAQTPPLLTSFSPCPVSPSRLQSSSASLFQVQQIAASLVGFLCYKAALVGVAVLPPPEDGALSSVLSGEASGGGEDEQRGF